MSRPRILAVDDTPANLLTLGASLAGDFDLQIATSGAQCLALATAEPPDIILLDIMMPEMDGYEVCRRLKADARLRQVPVVFVTALSEPDAEVTGLTLGAADYLTKPINVPVAKQRIGNLLERERLRKELEAQRDHLEELVEARTHALRIAETKYRTVADHTYDWETWIDPNGRYVYSSPSCERMTGHPVEAFVANPDLLIDITHPDDREVMRKHLHDDAKDAGPEEFTYRIQMPNGETRWVEHVCTPVFDGDGKLLGRRASNRDVTQRKRSEALLAERTRALALAKEAAEAASHAKSALLAELQATNKELESFSYSVSHDLRSPLRALHGYSHLLEEEYGGLLDATGHHYLSRIRSAAERMGQLIDDLLELAHLTRQELLIREIDLAAMVTDIRRELTEENPQRAVDWVIASDATVTADPTLMHLLLENLLRNAMKFTAEKAVARIEFGVDYRDDKREFFVRDNGAGFDMSYVNKLFKPFQRLHPGQRFEGTGIGLAIVRRILDRHGGSIRADAAPEKGATFYFALP